MIDDKRFKQAYVCGDDGLIDYEKPEGEQWIDLHSMSTNGIKNVQICINIMNDLADEIKQLKQRNTNQYNQLSELWQIIEEENWEKLQMEFKILCEKKGDVE